MFEIIPAIDLLDGQVVRLTQGDYDRVTHYGVTPVDLAKHYTEKGAKKIHLVDLNGAKAGKLVNLSVITAIREAVDCPIELGGGIRSLDDAKRLFDLGINELILGSLLTKNTPEAVQIIETWPSQIIAGLDTKDGQVAVEGWTESSEITIGDMIDRLKSYPLSAILQTNIAKDGMMEGPDITGLTEVSQLSPIPVIASGGVRSLSDISDLQSIGPVPLKGCVVGKAILSQAVSLTDLFALQSH